MEKRPRIVIDPRLERIRVTKATINSIGNPEFYSLVVSENAVRISASKSPDAHRVSRNSPELHQINLIRQIFALNKNWDIARAYCIFGNANNGSAVFPFESATEFVRKVIDKNSPPKSIKQTPPHDPAVLANSLIFTIPSWINAIERAALETNYKKISDLTHKKMKQALHSLSETANTMLEIMEEAHEK
jgi:hypothetical protein